MANRDDPMDTQVAIGAEDVQVAAKPRWRSTVEYDWKILREAWTLNHEDLNAQAGPNTSNQEANSGEGGIIAEPPRNGARIRLRSHDLDAAHTEVSSETERVTALTSVHGTGSGTRGRLPWV
jgi:hypothetical protein